jgi:putative ABC transport system permease protein
LKSNQKITDKTGGLRKALVIFQFSISLLIIIGTAVIYQQLAYLQNKKLGYNKDHVVVIHVGYRGVQSLNYKNALLSDSRIIDATGVTTLPSNILYEEYIDVPTINDEQPTYMSDNKHRVNYMSVDNDFFRTMDIRLIRGQEIIENLPANQYPNKYVLNQSALKEIGWDEDEALNQQIIIRHGNSKPGPVIGIVEDFHFKSLHYSISPLVLEFRPDPRYLLVRIDGENITESIEFLEAKWIEFEKEIPFEYSFLDQEYNMLYKAEMRTGKLLFVFAAASILIAMLGLFGLTSYSAVKRTKEIGIRKVFGATTANIISLLTREFTRTIIISILISVPWAIILVNKWLQEFTYKIEINVLLIVFAAFLVLILALFTVGYHSIRAANTNPVKALRYE